MLVRADDRSRLRQVRRLLLALLAVATLGTLVELLLIGHYEDPWQWAPLALMTVSLALLLWHALSPSRLTAGTLMVMMALFVAAGMAGVWLHHQAAREFQVEVNPSLGGIELFWKALQASAPPALAPGSLAALGGLGLVYLLTTSGDRL